MGVLVTRKTGSNSSPGGKHLHVTNFMEMEDIDDVLEEDKVTPLLEKLVTMMESQATTVADDTPGDDSINKLLETINGKIDTLSQPKETVAEKPLDTKVDIARDPNGLVTHVNGKPIKRDDKGLISGIE